MVHLRYDHKIKVGKDTCKVERKMIRAHEANQLHFRILCVRCISIGLVKRMSAFKIFKRISIFASLVFILPVG